MSTHKNIDRICLLVLVLTLLLTVAFMNGKSLGLQAVTDEDAESYTGTGWFTENDQDGSWSDNANTTYITLSGDTATVKGSGAYAYDGGVVISNGGWYVLSGTLTDGSIVVDAYNSSKVWLRLSGVDVTCSDDACLIVDQADKVFLTLAEGTENAFTGGESYSDAALEDNTGGVIFSHDDLTINGSGSLTVTANYKHGIDANDALVITGGTIVITAPQDGIHVNDSFRFMAADLTISAGDDAIHSDDELYVESGTILIPECYEGLEALTIDVVGGDITVYPDDDGFNANGNSTGMMGGFGGFGGFGGMGGMGGMHGTRSETGEDGQSAETENSESGEAATAPDMSGEAPDMSGEMPDMSGEAPEMNTAAETTTTDEAEETYIRISGGTVTIINEDGNDADGLDSNGSIYLDGGTVRISLKGDGGNCALDYGSESGGELIVTGGTLVACGGSSMVEEFSSTSTQCAVLYNLGTTAAAGTQFRVLDADGNELLSDTPACSYSSVGFSCPALAVGETYTVCVGETTEELTLSATATQTGESGGMGGGMGGGMRHGGTSDTGETSDMGSTDGMWNGGMNGEEGMTPPEQSGEDATGFSGRPTPPDWSENGESGFGMQRGHRGGPGFGQQSTDAQSTDTQSTDTQSTDTQSTDTQTSEPRSSDAGSGEESSAGMTAEPPGGERQGEDSGGMSGPPDMAQNGSTATDEAAAEETAVGETVSTDTWLLLGVCALVLAAGILFASRFKRY